ncbi:LacI family DNA-binding transcriptional regulator [Devosia rhodophyticola]|uniref:LacI family DNA-binding transcriptional regulator n=1 Tax=Devosia rhodophyticola TaxID=3026423 RepID=A0ABY7Z021_9HYPH|nr:LacI family DNA-binding transcriptional regulator [Devosia rhodophyticola]WDR06983.1 LacI family DNA-binding transcriptional regulator [Devosia rhodophyticola]
MRVSIKSIAKDLNISHMTVSRALSAHPNVNAKTREMVLRRAQEVGYVKNRAANTMRGESTGIVGLLLPNIVNDFYARFANELGLLCSDSGLDLLVNLTNDDPAREQAGLDKLLTLQASSVIFVPTPGDETRPVSPRDSTHFIELIRTRSAERRCLLVEDEQALRAAIAHLAARGCRRIGYIGAAPGLSSGQRRQQAYLEALNEAGFVPDQTLTRLGDPGRNFGMASMIDLLDNPNAPDGVLCGGFEISNGALEGCLTRGVQFPNQLAFVGYGDPELYRWLAGGISTVSVDAESLARQAILMVLAGPDLADPILPQVQAHLVLRQSA